MPIIRPDTSQMLDLSPIEPGTYPAHIADADAGVSKSGGPKVVVKMEVTVDGKVKNREAHISTTGAGAFNFDQLLRACHFDDLADQAKTGPIEFDTDSLKGQNINVIIKQEMYNGNPRDAVAGFMKA